MGDVILLFVLVTVGSIVGGIRLVAEGGWGIPGGLALIGFGLLVGYAYCKTMFGKHEPQQFPYKQSACPHKGERPQYGMLKRGYHYWAGLTACEFDSRTDIKCEACGYDPGPIHDVHARTIGAIRSLELLPVHP